MTRDGFQKSAVASILRPHGFQVRLAAQNSTLHPYSGTSYRSFRDLARRRALSGRLVITFARLLCRDIFFTTRRCSSPNANKVKPRPHLGPHTRGSASPARWPAAPASLPRLLRGAQVALAGSSLRALCARALPALSLHSDTPSHPNDGWARWPQISCDLARTCSPLPPQAPTVLPPPKNSLRSR